MKRLTMGSKYSLIGTREEMAEYQDRITTLTGTEEQSHIAANFGPGGFVGGRTMSAFEARMLIEKCSKHGAKVEEV